jgi:hypothetical protein
MAGHLLEWWPDKNRNDGREFIGTVAGYLSE